MLSFEPEKRQTAGQMLQFCGMTQLYLMKRPFVAARSTHSSENETKTL